MKLKMKKILLALIFSATFLASGQDAWASSLYLSPASGTVGLGGIISVRVNLNTAGEAVNGVSAILNYPADKLEVTGISYSGTFGIAAEGTSGGGAIRISRGNINQVSGNVNVATVSFRGKAPGSATISFVGGSAVPRASDSSDSYTGGSGGTYTISSTAAAPATAKPTASGNTTAVGETVAPIISDLKVEKISINSAIISWKTDQKSDSNIEYGLDKGTYFLSASDGNLVTEHSLNLEGPLLTPGTKFYFRVISRNANENTATSKEMEFQLEGYILKLRIIDDAGSPLVNTEVWLYSEPKTGKTNQDGEVTFENVSAGKHLVVVKQGSLEKTAEVLVNQAQSAKIPQKVDIKVARVPIITIQSIPTTVYIILGTLIVTAIIVWAYIFKKWRGKKTPTPTPPLK